jgi:tetratricopeptide (TPR) repeat protein
MGNGPRLLLYLGTLLVLLGNPASGTQDRARQAQLHANRGVAYLEQFRFSDAVAEFEALVALVPDRAAAHINLAIAYFNQRDFDRALDSLKKAETLEPANVYLHYNLGLIYKLQGRTEEAVAAFEKVAAADPEDAMTQYYLGTLYANLGQLEDAMGRLRRAIAIQPNNESAHFSLGNVLIRSGEVEEGRRELELFRQLKEAFPAEAASAGLQYTELGKYAEAIEESSSPLQQARPAATPASAIRWVEVTEAAGLGLAPLAPPPAWPETLPASEYTRGLVETRLLPRLGSGLAFRDLDGEGDPDLVAVRGGAPVVFLNEGGRFRQAASGLPSSGSYLGLTLGDVDNDGDADLFLAGARGGGLFLNEGKGSFRDATREAGLATNDVSVGASFADLDHDGDLDIYVLNYLDPDGRPSADPVRLPWDLPGAPNRLFQNNGNGTFTDVAAESLTNGGASRSLSAVFSDFDDDRDIDFVVVNDGQPLQAFSNDRVGTFSQKASGWGVDLSARIRGAASSDFDRDGSFDLFLTAEGAALNALFRGPAASVFRPDVLSPGLLAAGVPGGRFGATFLDADNDTDLDLLVVVNEKDALAAFYENTEAGFVRTGELRASAGEVGEGRALAVADFDGDGDLDAAVATDRGRVLLFRNEGGNSRGFLRVATQGLRSNRDGLGTKVEVKAGDARMRREVRAAAGYLSQDDGPLHFGLGAERAADYVRLLWPGGVKQIEMDVPGGKTVTIEELNRKGTSCPILYAWDGERMRFVTDFLGGSALGYLLSPGVYNTPDTDEYVKFEEFPLAAKDGAYELRWVNQLEEVLMYDRAALWAVDHPEDLEVFPNERLMPSPPYPEPRLYAVKNLRAPVRAVDDQGDDVTELVRSRDRRYPADFGLLPFKGYAELHSLTLDLGSLAPDEPVVLLLYGWVDYADSSANRAAAQAGARLVPPYLEVADAEGRFGPGRPRLEPMGFPAGLPKTMLVDLKGLLPAGASRVRITTSMRIYWDRILVATEDSGARLSVHEISPDRAELRFKGYPAPVRPDDREPALYDYERATATELWDQHEGEYTRYGDVRELVEAVDDLYVIARHGDELALSFDASRLPPVPRGQRRSFLLFADGFGKDMDLNSARPDTIEPLPFHAMSGYPYPPEERYPDTERHRLYRERYNTRRLGRGLAAFPDGGGNQ